MVRKKLRDKLLVKGLSILGMLQAIVFIVYFFGGIRWPWFIVLAPLWTMAITLAVLIFILYKSISG